MLIVFVDRPFQLCVLYKIAPELFSKRVWRWLDARCRISHKIRKSLVHESESDSHSDIRRDAKRIKRLVSCFIMNIVLVTFWIHLYRVRFIRNTIVRFVAFNEKSVISTYIWFPINLAMTCHLVEKCISWFMSQTYSCHASLIFLIIASLDSGRRSSSYHFTRLTYSSNILSCNVSSKRNCANRRGICRSICRFSFAVIDA